ncbi:MAG: hypothetical protein AB8B61_09980 [Cyclobacteriaceae bacterium]
MEKFNNLLTKYKDTFLPKGNIKLLNEDEVRSIPLYVQLLSNGVPNSILIETSDSIRILLKVTRQLFLEIDGKKDHTNLAVLKNLSGKIVEDLRSNAISIHA